MKVLTIGKRLLPADQVVFVEPFEPAANPELKSERSFKGRVILLDRDKVLTEQTPREFAEAHGLHLFAEDDVAINRTVAFKIETFEPTESFKPTKPYRTRLRWTDAGGSDQSKLLVSAPETVMAEIFDTKVDATVPAKRAARRPGRGRKGSSRMEAFQN
jgi:hypothetical protein